MGKRRFTMLLLVVTLFVFGSFSQSFAAERNARLSFGGNAPATTSYVINVAYAEIINTTLPGVTMTVEETGGGFDVIMQLIDGELDGCSSSAAPTYAAQNHLDPFTDVPNSDNFYAWLPMYTSPIQAIVKADSPIKSYSDFKDKRVAIDLVGTGSELIHRTMFDAFGIADTVEMLNVSKTEGMEMLKTNEADVSMITTAAPTAVILEFGTTEEYRIIPFTDEELQILAKAMPYMAIDTLPAGTYEQVKDPVPTLSLYTNAFLSGELDEELVYDMTKTVWENFDRVKASHPSQELVGPEMVRSLGTVTAYHPGAAKYYKEMGWID